MSAPTTREWLRTAVDRVAVGTRRLAARTIGRLIRVVQGRVGGWPWWVQLALAYLALLRGPQLLASVGDRIHERVESGAWTGVLTASALLWIVAAYRAGRDDWQPEPQIEPDQADGTEDRPQATTRPGPPPVSPVALVAAVRDIGTPHAQLKPLAEHLGATTDAVRAAAAGVGWPVKDVRMEGRSSSAGLRWDDCPSPTILAPSPSVVGAGQPADDNDDDASGEGGEKGLRVVPLGYEAQIIYDSRDTVRHHTVRRQ